MFGGDYLSRPRPYMRCSAWKLVRVSNKSDLQATSGLWVLSMKLVLGYPSGV